MSATIGTGLSLTISFRALLLSISGTETRTKSAPASDASTTCWIVLFISVETYTNKIYKVKYNISNNNLLEFIH